MKRFHFCIFLLGINLLLNAEDSTQYALFPGAEIYLPPGGKTTLFIAKRNNSLEAFGPSPVILSNKWMINGQDSEKQDAKFGKLSIQSMSPNTH